MQEDLIAVFPLPDVVFFPKTKLPLHVFEPRYQELVKETIQNRQLIGMFVLAPGWEEDYYGNPPVHPVGCAGEMVEVESQEEGKFDIVLKGIYRARLIEEVQWNPYRRARVEVLSDDRIGKGIAAMVKNLMADFQKLCTVAGSADTPDVTAGSDFETIVNSVATVLPLGLEFKLQLLQQDDLMIRARKLREFIHHQLALFDWTNRYARLRPTDPNLN